MHSGKYYNVKQLFFIPYDYNEDKLPRTFHFHLLFLESWTFSPNDLINECESLRLSGIILWLDTYRVPNCFRWLSLMKHNPMSILTKWVDFSPFKAFLQLMTVNVHGKWLHSRNRDSSGCHGLQVRQGWSLGSKWEKNVWVKTLTHEPKDKYGLGTGSPFWGGWGVEGVAEGKMAKWEWAWV